MAYQALYRKYRPQGFEDVVGQEHITVTLKNELTSGKISHAYLFTGTRGTGKTSCAKILAKAVNCTNLTDGEPCGKCAACVSISDGSNTDIYEIDAASNNSVDNIRDLRDQINFTPASSKYRVYIIDEVHMLSSGAFNALLKTLEEPPAHVIFILATTEVHKLPATILSRCQRFDFHRIDRSVIEKRIRYIADAEKITVSDGALSLVSTAADGSMRDALSIFDLCAANNDEIDEKTVETVCGMASLDYLLSLADHIKHKDTESALVLLDKLYSASVDMSRLLDELTKHYRNLMIVKTVSSGNKPVVCSSDHLKKLEEQADDYPLSKILSTLTFLHNSVSAMQGGNKKLQMEMILVKLCNAPDENDYMALADRVSALEKGITKSRKTSLKEDKIAEKVKETAEEEPVSEIKEAPQENTSENTEAANAPAPLKEWQEILRKLMKTCPPIAGVLSNSAAYIDGDILRIDSDSPVFREMMNKNLYNEDIKNAAEEILGKRYKLGPYRKRATGNSDDPLLALAEKIKDLQDIGGN